MTKNKTQKKSFHIMTILTMILCFTLCISFADLFSSLITVGGLNLIKNNELKEEEFILYAISLYKVDTKIKADNLADIVIKKGGAGYVYEIENQYHVLASCYENKADAEKVKTNLDNSSVKNEIIELRFKEIKIEAKVNEKEKTVLKDCISVYKTLYKKLYDLSISIDTKVYNEIEARMNLGEIISEFTKTKTNFETIFNQKLSSKMLQIKLSLNNISKILSNLVDSISKDTEFSSKIKLSYFNILNEYNVFLETI